jgi:hypothetical protein
VPPAFWVPGVDADRATTAVAREVIAGNVQWRGPLLIASIMARAVSPTPAPALRSANSYGTAARLPPSFA